MRTTGLLTVLVTFAATLASASPTPQPQDIGFSDASAANPLTKRYYTACSNGVALKCGDASISCEGEDCTVCCGSCCKSVQAPENSSCNGATPIVKVKCGKKGKGRGKKGKGKGKGKNNQSQSGNDDSGLLGFLDGILHL